MNDKTPMQKTPIQKTPTHTRRNVESYDDPYIEQESLTDNTPCKRCG